MKQSELFTKTRKEVPKDEVSENAKLLIKAGYIHKEMAGVYSYLPLGLRVLKKIENIIRSEMNKIGGQEVFMTTLQNPDLWKASGRWDDKVVDNWFKSTFAAGGEVGIANTHEEPLANLLKQYVHSYKNLPIYVYQIQNKFRNELRAKSGLMRGREFLMKDLYSFSRTEEEFRDFYESAAKAYLIIFKRVGLGKLTYRTFASGGSFSKFSDEFQTISDAGEDTIYLDQEKNIAVNKEVYTDDVLAHLHLDKAKLKEVKSIEVGNIFPLATRFAEAIGLTYRDEKGKECYPIMGSYGIGLGRLMGTIVEVHHDDKGIIWPETVAPFKVHLLEITSKSKSRAKKVYEELQKAGVETLYDDRSNASAGEKFADADLIGLPYRLVISEKTGSKVELRKRSSKKPQLINYENLRKVL